MNWTQEQCDELFRLWDNGRKSYSELAKHFGVTKNSIVGRMRREKQARGIEMEHQYSHRSGRPRSPTDKPQRRQGMLTLPSRAEFVVSAYRAAPVAVPDEGHLASIVDVTGCRWPVRDDESYVGGVAFCNHSQADGKAYCPYHTQVAKASYSRTLIRKTVKDAIKVAA